MQSRSLMHILSLICVILLPTARALAQQTVMERCLKEKDEKGWSMAEYRVCKAEGEEEEAKRLTDRACNEKLCIYRLTFVAPGTYRGSGYTLQPDISFKSGIRTSILTDDSGKRGVLEQSCGAGGCPVAPQTVSGTIRGASFKGPFGTGKESYVVLELPRSDTPPGGESAAGAPITACRNNTVRLGAPPCALEGRTVDYRFEIDVSQTFKTGFRQRYKDSIVQRLKFTKTDDVYLFQGSDTSDRLTDSGFIYKLDIEIDFSANRARAPKLFPWDMYKSYRGRITFEDRTLTRVESIELTRGGSPVALESKLRFSPDFKTCSVVQYSTGGTSPERSYTMTLDRNVECNIR